MRNTFRSTDMFEVEMLIMSWSDAVDKGIPLAPILTITYQTNSRVQ